MIGYIIIIIIIGIIVSIITEQMLIRRLRLEEGIVISKGKCILKPGYGPLPSIPATPPNSLSNENNERNNELLNFYKPLK
jgi:hypothetical protein